MTILAVPTVLILASVKHSETKPQSKFSSDDSSEENYGFYEFHGNKFDDLKVLKIWFGIPPTEDEKTTTEKIKPVKVQQNLDGKNS